MSISHMRSGMFLQSKSRVCAELPIHCRCPRMSHKLHSQRIRMTFLQYQTYFSFHPCVSCKPSYCFNTTKLTLPAYPKPHHHPSSLPLPYSHLPTHPSLSKHSKHSKTIKTLLPTVPSSTRLDKSEPLRFPIHHSTPEIFDYSPFNHAC